MSMNDKEPGSDADKETTTAINQRPTFYMNPGTLIDLGPIIRAGRMLSSGEEKDDTIIDVDALLVETAESERQKTRLATEAKAQNVVNTLQKWLDDHPDLADLDHWHRAYALMLDVIRHSGRWPESLFIYKVSPRATNSTTASMARGGFAEIFSGTYNKTKVAMKRLKVGRSTSQDTATDEARQTQRFIHEALVWKQLKHENILPLLGVYWHYIKGVHHPCMISPWIESGTIMRYVQKDNYKYSHRSMRGRLLKDVASGLKYIHDRNIVHGDLHGGNVLISEGRAMLADFGLAVVGDGASSDPPAAGASRWLAPELIKNGVYLPLKTKQADIFAFGRLCLAVTIRGPPMPEFSDGVIARKVEGGYKPVRPSREDMDQWMHDALWELACQCWEEAGKRPTADELVEAFTTGKARR